MRFQELRLRNWRNFGNVNFELTNRVFIIGANAAGKSNLLDVFRFLKDVTADGLQKAVNARGGIKKLRYLNARSQNYIEIFVRLTEEQGGTSVEWTYTLQFNSAGGKHENRDINIKLEKITCGSDVLEDRKYQDGDYLSNQFTYLEQPAMNTKYRALYECFRDISYVNIIPQLIRESDSFIPSASTEDFYGRNLLENISAAPKKSRATKLNVINKILKLAVPQFSNLEYTQDEKGRPHLQVKYEHFRPQGAYQREDQFSDGTLRLLGIIWAILDGTGVLLLEEPELYLHSEIVKQLPMFIANAQKSKIAKNRQVIISSHSFDLLDTDTIDLDEIMILEPGKEGTVVEKASESETARAKVEAGYTPADAVIPKVTPKGIMEGQLSLFDFGLVQR